VTLTNACNILCHLYYGILNSTLSVRAKQSATFVNVENTQKTVGIIKDLEDINVTKADESYTKIRLLNKFYDVNG
jgi:hypothetical protein